MRVLAYTCLIFVVLMAVIQQLIYLPQLPAEVVSQYDLQGQPRAKMPKESFAMLMFGLTVGLPAFLGLLGANLHYLPNSLINVPHKEYWLAPERRTATLRDMEFMLAWMATSSALLIMGLSHLTYQANMANQGLDNTQFNVMLGFYLAFVLGLVLRSCLRYRLPLDQDP